jgi:hypothetical protein
MSNTIWIFSNNLLLNQWNLVFWERSVVYFGQQDVSTNCELFVGTKDECEAKIKSLNLTTQELLSAPDENDELFFTT